jgi:hypothetical protein
MMTEAGHPVILHQDPPLFRRRKGTAGSGLQLLSAAGQIFAARILGARSSTIPRSSARNCSVASTAYCPGDRSPVFSLGRRGGDHLEGVLA